jgi:predicted acylesterase/phospholipase RssA
MAEDNNKIALSLSGGGIRASGFHLGTLDYLNKVELLQRVTIISSVSGGSLPAIGYALSQKTKMPFEEFYQGFFEFLPPLDTIGEILDSFTQARPVVASTRRDLITSWADVFRKAYFDRYFDDPDFNIFWNDTETHLEEVIFNATEFKSGIAFRFQHSESSTSYRVGNGKISISHDQAKQMKVSDVMAASACIPLGMEPMQFPQDFHWPNDDWNDDGPVSRPVCDTVVDSFTERYAVDRVALMDGGVYDNQCISSVLLAMARHQEIDQQREFNLENDEPGFKIEDQNTWLNWFNKVMNLAAKEGSEYDMYIISDTPLRHDPMYEPDPDSCIPAGNNNWIRRLTLAQVDIIFWIVIIALGLSTASNLWSFFSSEEQILAHEQSFLSAGNLLHFATMLIPGVIAGLLLLVILKIRHLVNTNIGKLMAMSDSHPGSIPSESRRFWQLVKDITVGNLWDMVMVRVHSVSAMMSRVSMNRKRQLEYSLVYSNEQLRGKLLAHEIYALLNVKPVDYVVSEDLLTMATKASSLRTKLWINTYPDNSETPPILRGRNELQMLVAVGQATTIVNLMTRFGKDHEMYPRLLADWELINAKPFHFVDNR